MAEDKKDNSDGSKQELNPEIQTEQQEEFYILAPKILSKEEYEFYAPAINQALNNKSIKNIAITGCYGAGKSSIIETAKTENPDLVWADVSLAHFQTETNTRCIPNSVQIDKGDKQNGGDPTTTDSNIKSQQNSGLENQALAFSIEERAVFNAEAALLNQLIFQINPKSLPRSRFKRTVSEDSIDIRGKALLAVSFILSLMYLIYFANLRLDMRNNQAIDGNSFASFLSSSTLVWVLTGISLIFIVIGLYIFISNQLQTRSFSRVLHRLKLLDTEIELFNESNSFPLEEYADDIVYMLLNSDIDIVVFEDLDRFNSIGIFERLRAINSLINNTDEDNSRPIKFIYLIRDSLFKNASDRLKFFDLIIPVIPFVDTESSFSELTKALGHFGIKPGETFLYQLSLFISDPRALFEIANEAYQLKKCAFNAKCEAKGHEAEKIVALATYKVVFPQDFERMYSNTSIIDVLLSMRDVFADTLNQDLSAQIEVIDNEIKELNSIAQMSDENIDLLYMLPNYRELQDRAKEQGAVIESVDTLEEFKEQFKRNEVLERVLKEHLESITDPNYEHEKSLSKAKIVAKIGIKENQRENLKFKAIQMKMQELPRLLRAAEDSEKFYKLPFEHNFKSTNVGEGWVESYRKVYKSPSFNLIRFFINGGYIDGSRYKYISKFHEGGMPFRDREYLAALIQNKKCNSNQKISNPDLFLARTTHVDLAKEGARNYSLLSFLIKGSRSSEIECIFQGINYDENYSFLVEYICSEYFNSDVFLHIKENLCVSFAVIINDKGFSKQQRRLVCQKIAFTAPDEFVFPNISNAVADFASEDSGFLCIDPSLENFDKSKFFRITYYLADINIDISDPDLVEKVYEKNLYVPNLHLVRKMLIFSGLVPKNISIQDLIVELALKPEIPVVKCIEGNANIFIDSLTESLPEDDALVFEDDKPIVWMLNLPNLSLENAEKLISRVSKEAVKEITEIKNDGIKTLLFKVGLVENTGENILNYFKLDNTSEIDDALANYINNHEVSKDLSNEKMKSIVGNESFLTAIIECPTLSDEKVCKIISGMQITYKDFSLSGISLKRVKSLIGEDIIAATKANLKRLRENYCPEDNLDAVIAFALKYQKKYLWYVMDGVGNSLFSEAEALELLKKSCMNYNHQLSLLTGFAGYIDTSTQYKDCINERIIRSHYDPMGTQKLIDEYEQYGTKSKNAIVEQLYNYLVNDSLQSLSVTRPCLDDLIAAYVRKEDHLALIIESQLNGATRSVLTRSDLSDLFELAEMNNFYKLINGKRVRVKISHNNQRLLDALQKNGFCGKYREMADGEYYYVYANRG